MYLQEVGEEPTSINPVATTFHVKEEWATYIKPYVGQPFTPKELDALGNFKEKQPITTARTEIWYKTTDTFGISHITVIKKMKDSGQFSFTSFQKQEKPESPDEKKKKEQEKQMNAGGPLGAAAPLGGSLNLEVHQKRLRSAAPPGSPNPPAENLNSKKRKKKRMISL